MGIKNTAVKKMDIENIAVEKRAVEQMAIKNIVLEELCIKYGRHNSKLLKGSNCSSLVAPNLPVERRLPLESSGCASYVAYKTVGLLLNRNIRARKETGRKEMDCCI